MFEGNQYDSNIPIYLQIMEKIKQRIVSGEWKPGERIPAVRELALEFGVNPNTMQRALSELEREGLLFSERTAGRFITRDSRLIEEIREQMAEDLISRFLTRMRRLGYSGEEVRCKLLSRHMKDPDGE